MSLCPAISLYNNALLVSHTLAKLHCDSCNDIHQHHLEAVAALQKHLESERCRVALAKKELRYARNLLQ